MGNGGIEYLSEIIKYSRDENKNKTNSTTYVLMYINNHYRYTYLR